MQSTLLEIQLAFTGAGKSEKLAVPAETRRSGMSDSTADPARTAFDMLMQGKTVKQSLRDQLGLLCIPVLGAAYRSGGMQNTQWKLWLRAVRDIVESVQPELLLLSSDVRKQVVQRGTTALRTLSRQHGIDAAAIRRIGKELSREYSSMQRDAVDSDRWAAAEVSGSEVAASEELAGTETANAEAGAKLEAEAAEAVAKLPGNIRASSRKAKSPEAEQEEVTEETPSQVLAILAESFRPGLWFKIFREDSRAARWLKVASYDGETRLITFSNREGAVAEKRDAVAFMRDLAQGKAELVHDSDQFERNLEKVISESQRR